MQHFSQFDLVRQGCLNTGLLRFIQSLVVAILAIFITIASLLSLDNIADVQANNTNPTTLLRLSPKISSRFASGCDYQTKILTDNPIAYWRLGEISGTTAVNIGSLGSAVDGTYQGGVSLGVNGLLAGESDTAVYFDGIDDRIDIPDHDAINTGLFYNARTIELWFKADTVDGRQILYEEGGDLRGLNIYIDTGNLYVNGWNVATNGGTTAPWGPTFVSTPISTNTIYHTALVFAADTTGPSTTLTGTITGYLNGSSFGVVSGTGQLFGHGANIGLGAAHESSSYHDGTHGATPYRFTGIIDEVALYNDSLSGTQIQTHYLACINPTPSPIYLPIIMVNS